LDWEQSSGHFEWATGGTKQYSPKNARVGTIPQENEGTQILRPMGGFSAKTGTLDQGCGERRREASLLEKGVKEFILIRGR